MFSAADSSCRLEPGVSARGPSARKPAGACRVVGGARVPTERAAVKKPLFFVDFYFNPVTYNQNPNEYFLLLVLLLGIEINAVANAVL